MVNVKHRYSELKVTRQPVLCSELYLTHSGTRELVGNTCLITFLKVTFARSSSFVWEMRGGSSLPNLFNPYQFLSIPTALRDFMKPKFDSALWYLLDLNLRNLSRVTSMLPSTCALLNMHICSNYKVASFIKTAGVCQMTNCWWSERHF